MRPFCIGVCCAAILCAISPSWSAEICATASGPSDCGTSFLHEPISPEAVFDSCVRDYPFIEIDDCSYPLYMLHRDCWQRGPCGPRAAPSGDAQVLSPEIVNARFVPCFKSSEALLPAPIDANDLFFLEMDPAQQRLPNAWAPFSAFAWGGRNEKVNLWSRFKAMPTFGFAHDTGFVGPAFSVQDIALGQSQMAGQTHFIGAGDLQEVPLTLIFDNQFKGGPTLYDQQVQFYIEANNEERVDELRLAHIYARLFNLERTTIGAGKSYSLFGVGGVLPATIEQNAKLIGAGELGDDDRPLQLRIQRSTPVGGGWGGGLAIEDPLAADYAAPMGAVPLTRWPTFTGNVRYLGPGDIAYLQFSALVRTMGFEAANGVEHFDTGWGLSAYGRFATVVDTEVLQGFYAGVAGGEGIGEYVHGVSTSAAFDAGTFSALEGLGTYIGYRQQWITPGNWQVGTNAAYGYAMMDTVATLAADTNRELHQAWANILVMPNPQVAVGVEYQYGKRETLAMGDGENHRFMLVVALASSGSKDRQAGYLDEGSLARSYGAGSGGGASKQRF